MLAGYLLQFTNNGSTPQLVAPSSNFMLHIFQQGNLQKRCLSSALNTVVARSNFSYITVHTCSLPVLIRGDQGPWCKRGLIAVWKQPEDYSVLPGLTRAYGTLLKLCRWTAPSSQGLINEMTFTCALKGSRIIKGWRQKAGGSTISRRRNSTRKGTDEWQAIICGT